MTTPAETNPGTVCGTRSSTLEKKTNCSSRVSYRSPSMTDANETSVGSNPGSTFCSRTKLSISRLAPISNMSASATWATTNVARTCPPTLVVVARAPLPARLMPRMLASCTAGMAPKMTPVAKVTSSVKPKTVPSMDTSVRRGKLPGSMATSA